MDRLMWNLSAAVCRLRSVVMGDSLFQYKHAIVRRIPDSLRDFALRSDNSEPIDLEKARKDHQSYINALKSCGLNIIEIEKDERYPDSPYVEDCAVVIGDTAVMTKPGHKSRRGEVEKVREILKHQLNKNIIEIEDSDATVDGGDVLYTGEEILVGLSNRTNEKGVLALKNAFPHIPITPIPVDGKLHLKTAITLAGKGTLAAGVSHDAQHILKHVKTLANSQYKYFTVENDDAANMVFANNKIIHRSLEEIGKESYQAIVDNVKYSLIGVNNSELGKADGSLTCCSILIQ